jgi:CHAT domain-containing protein/tetratricopeptide (TPR) repeat protein
MTNRLLTQAFSENLVRGSAHLCRLSARIFSHRQVARASLLVLIVSLFFSQTVLAKPVVWLVQETNPCEGNRLIQEGQRLSELGTRAALTQAIDKYKAAYVCFQKDNFRKRMGGALFFIGVSYLSLGQKRRALDGFLEASTYIKETEDFSLHATIIAIIGLVYTKLSEWSPAINYLEQALAFPETEKTPELLASVLIGLGGTYMKLGKKQKGLEYVDKALSIIQKIHDRDLETQALSVMGGVFSSLGQKPRALESAQRALQIAREDKNHLNESRALLSLGEIQDSLGDRQKALSHYNEALQVGMEANDQTWKPTILHNMASIYLDFGEIDKAMALFEKSIQVSRTEGEPEDAGLGLNGLAVISELQGEPLKALNYYQQALALARTIKDQSREAAVLVNIASLYASFNQLEQGLKANHEAVATFKAIEDSSGESAALANIGDIHNRLGRPREALNWLNQALELQRVTGNRRGEAHTLLQIGDTYRISGDLPKALGVYTDALALATAINERVEASIATGNLGLTYELQGNYQKASECYLRALPLIQSIGDHRGEATLLGNLGSHQEKMGNLKEAEEFYEQAIDAREQVRNSARLEEFKTEVAGASAELYAQVIALKIKLGKTAEAFELSERARARTLLDQMNNARIDMRKSANRQLIEQEQALRFELASLEKKIREEMAHGCVPETCEPLKKRLEQGQQAYAETIIRLKANNPEYAELQGYAPISRNEIQRLLGPETTLLSYYVSANQTVIFVTTRNSFKAVEVPVGEKELRNAASWFRSFARTGNSEPASLKQLDNWLIAPVRQYIKTPFVCVIPHGILHQLPFAALNDGKAYFGEQHTIYYLPAASLLPFVIKRARNVNRSMLAIAQAKAEGWPALHYVDQEARTLAQSYDGKLFLTGQASKAEFLRHAGDYDILHIAAHAELNTRSPLFSRILLAPDQNGSSGLEVREIYDLNLSHTNLVVLSACETQLGAQSRGDDIVGLNRAFLYAGASSIIASLWRVDDQATSLLMRSFYTHLKQGMAKAEALRMAQAETRRKYPNPYYWAAFVLTGDAGLPGVRHIDVPRRTTPRRQ